MKVIFTGALALSLFFLKAAAQKTAHIPGNSRNTFSGYYDSSYDFSELWLKNRNPKDLIGQELEFAPPSLNHVIGSDVSIFHELEDSLFICFSSPVTTKLSNLISGISENATGFHLVDCTRHPFDYSNKFLKDSATTNTYKPVAVLTSANTFALRADTNEPKKAIVVGTPYAILAGKTFRIKDASCYFDYYDSNVSYFFILTDEQNNELTFYSRMKSPLEQMIHIKGFIKKYESLYVNSYISFVSSFKVSLSSGDKLMGFQVSPDYFKNRVDLYNKKWICTKYKYVSTPERYFQTLYLELRNEFSENVCVYLYDME